MGKTTNFISRNADGSYRSAIAKHGYRENASPLAGHRDFTRVLRVSQHVLDLCDLTCEDCPARRLVGPWRSWVHAPEDFHRLRWKVMERDDIHELPIEQVHGAHMRMTEAHSVG